MRLTLIVGLLALASACESGPPVIEAPARSQQAQVTFAGGLFISASLNRLVGDKGTIRDRRRALRRPLWRLYELLKGPAHLQLRTETVSAVYRPLGKGGELPDPALAEMLMLAGIDTVSLGSPMMSAASTSEVETTRKALDRWGVAAIGEAESSEADSISGLRTKIVDLGEARVALIGLYLTDQELTGNGVAALQVDQGQAAVTAVKSAVDAARKRADLAFLVLGWHSKLEREVRRGLCHDLIDDAGVDAVLAHHAGAFEGLEAHGKGVIIHNPAPALLMRLGEGETRPALVFRIHLHERAIDWIEAQPIEVLRKRSRIGIEDGTTHGTIDRFVKLSRELGTTVENEYGRGIWEARTK
jgi:hypothetical protein